MIQLKKTLARAGVAVAAVAMLAPAVVFAQTGQNPFQQAQNFTNQVGTSAGITTNRSLYDIFGSIINIVLGFLGILLLAYLLYAGFLWMTAGGDKDKVTKAQDMIRNAIIGLVIIVAAFAISNFVLSNLVNLAR